MIKKTRINCLPYRQKGAGRVGYNSLFYCLIGRPRTELTIEHEYIELTADWLVRQSKYRIDRKHIKKIKITYGVLESGDVHIIHSMSNCWPYIVFAPLPKALEPLKEVLEEAGYILDR